MLNGTVKWFSAQRGCAFLVPDGGDATVAHRTSVERTVGILNEGRRGGYDVNRARGRRFSAANCDRPTRPARPVLSHVSGERGGLPGRRLRFA